MDRPRSPWSYFNREWSLASTVALYLKILTVTILFNDINASISHRFVDLSLLQMNTNPLLLITELRTEGVAICHQLGALRWRVAPTFSVTMR